MTLYWGVRYLCISVFARLMGVCTALNVVFFPSVAMGLLISQSLPAKSVAGPGYGPLVLILAEMMDSPGAAATGLALWLAVSMLGVTLCHREEGRMR